MVPSVGSVSKGGAAVMAAVAAVAAVASGGSEISSGCVVLCGVQLGIS